MAEKMFTKPMTEIIFAPLSRNYVQFHYTSERYYARNNRADAEKRTGNKQRYTPSPRNFVLVFRNQGSYSAESIADAPIYLNL
jgi:hypothetical protein